MKYKLLVFILLIVALPYTSHAADFVGLVGIPGLENPGEQGGLGAYINTLYRLSISIAALLAVIKIVAAGAKYMLSDIVTHKEDAKKDIQGALIGLLIVIGAIIILNTVNSDLTNLEISMATTTIIQGPTIEEYLEEMNRGLADLASSTNSREMIFTCRPGALGNVYYDNPEEGREEACQRICRDVFDGRYTDVWALMDGTSDTCHFVEGVAAQCNPNLSGNCCVTVNGATWDEETRTCSGLAEAREASKLECGRDDKVWNETGNYCTTLTCDPNTNANCCTADGNAWMNNSCVSNDITEIDEVLPLPETTLLELRNNLEGLPTELQNSIIERAQNNIGGNLLTANDNVAVLNEQGAEAMVLSASLPTDISQDRRALIENAIAVVCSDVTSITTYSGSGIVTGSLADGTDYIACVR